MDINFEGLGKQLKLTKRSEKKKPLSEKEIFIDLVVRLDQAWNNSNIMYEQFKVNLLEYEEQYFTLIEDLILLKYGDWKTEIILWYVYGRIDEEGNMYSLMLTMNDEKKEVVINNPTQLWDFIKMIEKNRK
jgi:hypothetical protein